MSREFLVTKFACAKCGNNLSVSPAVQPRAGRHAEGEPTGAAMVQQVVAVEPCRLWLAPLQEMRMAIKTLASCVAMSEGQE